MEGLEILNLGLGLKGVTKFEPWRPKEEVKVGPISDDCKEEVMEPDLSMAAAAVVADAMVVAERGRGWLWVPSYVVIKMDMSSGHL